MAVLKSTKGLEINMLGAAKQEFGRVTSSEYIGFCPDDFHGIIPKPIAKVGDKVKVGSVLFVDKANPQVKIVSPVSGELFAINRGERRKILDIVVKNDFKSEAESIEAIDLNASASDIVSSLCNAGLFAFLKQRPYDVIANPSDTPRAIFISLFDKAPLAPDFNFILKNEQADLLAGISVLSKIAKVYVGAEKSMDFAANIKNAEVNYFEGSYPISNVGVQINMVAPINKNEVVWTITPQEVVMIGRYASKGKLDFTKTIAFAGELAAEPAYYNTIVGANAAVISAANVSTGIKGRYISGNPLSGKQIADNQWLNPFASQLTVLPEGDDTHELFGWIMPRFGMYSLNSSFLSGVSSFLRSKMNFSFDTRVLGGERNMIMSGEYDKVFPMDIYPEFLIKAIIAGNIDKMEALGIYEVAPEDFAAAEFACSSKMELQKIVRKGLDMLRKEMA